MSAKLSTGILGDFVYVFLFINAVEISVHCKGEAQKDPLSGDFLGGFAFSRCSCFPRPPA